MKLSELMCFEKIVIQCHDNPDPDSISAGYALYRFFKSKGKEVRLIYSGNLIISKPNIMLLVNELQIPIEYVEELKVDGLLITVDCQYGAGNVRRFEAKEVAIIDHHIQEVPVIERQEVRSDLASACTVVWNLLMEEGFDISEHLDISTALYYGLFIDSSAFIEVHNALDKDMTDSLAYDKQLLKKLRNSILTLRELEIAGMALIRHSYNATNKYVMVKAQECDPNILGLISDFALQVDCVNVCIVYNEASEGLKFSVRSCVKEVMANELAAFIASDIGTGGGHIDRAAGFISKKKFDLQNAYLSYDEYFLRKLTEYYQSFEVIEDINQDVHIESMKHYEAIASSMGYVKLGELLPDNTQIVIRCLEEDIEKRAQKKDYLIIDPEGAVTLIDEKNFFDKYHATQDDFNVQVKYFPRIKRQDNQQVIHLKPHTKLCILKKKNNIFARPIEKAVKIFTKTDSSKYKYGKVGDYLAVNEEDRTDIYIIEKRLFEKNYQEIK